MIGSISRLAAQDYQWSLLLNQLSERDWVRRFFSRVSAIGDGSIWYVVILGSPLVWGSEAWQASFTLAIVALSGVAVYKVVKSLFRRPRPFRQHPDIHAAALALDEWSFPSGHTLHATAFTLVLLTHLPILGWIFLPFAVLTAISRVVLGLHYPSDVVFGAVVGGVLAKSALLVSATLWAI